MIRSWYWVVGYRVHELQGDVAPWFRSAPLVEEPRHLYLALICAVPGSVYSGPEKHPDRFVWWTERESIRLQQVINRMIRLPHLTCSHPLVTYFVCSDGAFALAWLMHPSLLKMRLLKTIHDSILKKHWRLKIKLFVWSVLKCLYFLEVYFCFWQVFFLWVLPFAGP